MDDLARPPTEVEIAEALMAVKVETPFAAEIIRRLAFERYRLRADSRRWRWWMRKLESLGMPIARIQNNTDESLAKENDGQ